MPDAAPAQLSKSVGHRERRRKLRKSAENLSLVTVEMGSAGFGLMLDVSEGGVGVQVMNRVEPGTDVRIAFKVPELATRIEGNGVVTWCDGEGRLGIRFQQLKDSCSKELQQWVDSLPEATAPEPIELPPLPSPSMVTDQVRAIKSQIAASKLDVDLVLQFLVERVVELTHSNGGAIALGEGANMVCRASCGLAPEVGVSISTSSALTSECIRTGKIVRCDDTETDLRVNREICRELNLRSSLILPILFEENIKGVLEVFSPLPRAFTEKHLALLHQLAEFTAQIVYGPMPVSAAEIESSAKTNAKPEHTALSALLTATTKATEVAPKPTENAAVKPQVVPPAAKPVENPEPAVAAKSVSSSGAAVKPAIVAEPALAKKSSGTKEPAVKESVAVAKPAKAVVAAVTPSDAQAVVSASDLLEDEPEATGSKRYVYLAIAVVLALAAGLGWFYLSRRTPTSQPVVPAAAITQPQPQPATSTTVPETPVNHTSTAAKTEPGLVAADTIRSPHSAVVKADQSTPIEIAPGSTPRPRNEAPVAEAPSIAVSSNLGGIALPGSTAKPELRPQGVVTGGSLLKRVEPVYPQFAKQQRIQGDIILSARVTKDGTLDRIKRVKGNPIFEPAAIAALSQWRYEPYKLNGQPQDVDTTVTLQFRFKQ